MKVLNVVGTRPNLIKIAPLVQAMRTSGGIEQILLHTGQHYDDKMSRVFFDQLGIPRPDISLEVGSGSHAQQTAKIMVAFEPVLMEQRPDLVVVVGDVNSTLACTVTAAKLCMPVAHVEAGLRSFDRTMPEEINRIVTDALSDFLFTTSPDADQNLLREGVAHETIFFVGNVMIDSLRRCRGHARQLNTPSRFGLAPGNYALLTLHRASNVDQPEIFTGILDAVIALARDLPVLFPAHPRTARRIAEFGLEVRLAGAPDLQVVDPLGYLEFLDLMMHARLVMTDSGGVQEETTILDVPCLTVRENTERPITITQGTNQLVTTNPQRIIAAARDVLARGAPGGGVPEFWDGRAAERIVKILKERAA